MRVDKKLFEISGQNQNETVFYKYLKRIFSEWCQCDKSLRDQLCSGELFG